MASSRRRNFCHPCANLTPRGLPQDMHVSFPRGDTYLLPFSRTMLRLSTAILPCPIIFSARNGIQLPYTTMRYIISTLNKDPLADSRCFRTTKTANKRKISLVEKHSSGTCERSLYVSLLIRTKKTLQINHNFINCSILITYVYNTNIFAMTLCYKNSIRYKRSKETLICADQPIRFLQELKSHEPSVAPGFI